MCEVGTELSTLIIFNGYFRFSALSTEIYKCPTEEACPGGTNVSSCAEGYSGPLCQTCAAEPEPNRFFKDSNTGLCQSCAATGGVALSPGAIVLGVLLLVALGGAVCAFVWREQIEVYFTERKEALFRIMNQMMLVVCTCQIMVSYTWGRYTWGRRVCHSKPGRGALSRS